jgi:hypothetical protein
LLIGAFAWTVAPGFGDDAGPSISFHTAKSSFVCYDKTPEAFAKNNPDVKVVEGSIRVSANFDVDEQQVDRVEYRLRMPDGFVIVDYLPKTTLDVELSKLRVGDQTGRNTVKVVAVEGGASVGFRIPGLGAEVGGGVRGGSINEEGKSVNSSVEMEILPPKVVLTASNTEDDGRVLHFKLQQRGQHTLQGDKDYVFLAEVPKSWTAGAFQLECTAFLKGSFTPGVMKAKTVGIYLAGEPSARGRAEQLARTRPGWVDLRPNGAVRIVTSDPVTPSSPEPAAQPTLKTGQLPIDGAWTTRISLNGSMLPEQPVTVKNGELHIDGDKTFWKDIKLKTNGHYSALRITPGVFSNWEHEVEFLIDDEGYLRQDDSNLSVVWRSLGKVMFAVKKLDDEKAFKGYHKR